MHVRHAVLPLSGVNLPGEHWLHVAWPAEALNRPGKHGACAVEPVAHAEPAGHAVQSLASSRFGLLEKVPATHGAGLVAPSEHE